MSRIEGLENRRLLAALVPDVTWADDGYLTQATDQGLIASNGFGLFASTSVYGTKGQATHVRRYDADGTVAFDYGNIAGDVDTRVDTSGRLYAATAKEDQVTLTRYGASGKVDRAFGGRGTVAFSLNDPGAVLDAHLSDVTLTPDGSAYIAFTHLGTIYNHAGHASRAVEVVDVYKFDRFGRVDRTFGDRGRIDYKSVGSDDFTWSGVTTDGRITFASGDYDIRIVRYLPNGTLDKGFGDNGTLQLHDREVIETGLAYDAQDRLVLAGQQPNKADQAVYRVRRLTAAGQPDTTFGTNGTYTPSIPAGNTVASNVFVLPDGRILAKFDTSVIRVTDRGLPDTTFDGDGVAEIEVGAFDLLGTLPDGSLLASASSYDSRRVGDYHVGVAKLAPQSAAVVGHSGALYLNGTDAADTVRIDPVGRRVRVTMNGKVYGPFAGVAGVRATLLDGDNSFDGSAFTGRVPQTVVGGNGNDTIATGGGRDFVFGDFGDDTLRTNGERDTVGLGEGNNTADGGDGDDTIQGGSENDRITAGNGNDTIEAGDGNDTVTGGDGDDLLRLYGFSRFGEYHSRADGGAGNDTILSSDDRDTIYAGPGDDRVGSYRTGAEDPAGEEGSDGEGSSSPSIPALADVLGDFVDLGPGNDRVNAPAGGNTITGGDGDDTLRAGLGNDSLDGGAGRDSISSGDGRDTLTGGVGPDRLNAGLGNDRLSGGTDDDVLLGGPGRDTLSGEGGNDTLIAGPAIAAIAVAANRLDGGAGTDRFQTESADDVLASVESRLDA